MEKSAPLTGGKYDAVLGAGVGSALIAEQLTVEVGVFTMPGFTRVGVEVGVACAAQAPSMKTPAVKNNEKEIRFIMDSLGHGDCFVVLSSSNLFRFGDHGCGRSWVKTRALLAMAWIYGITASFNCSKSVIQEIVLTKSANDLLWARRARTAGPTGSCPAAPPGVSA